MEKELRIIDGSQLSVETREVRAEDGSTVARKVVTGRAVVFNQLSQNLGWFREQIDPRAFDGCDMSDCVALKNHDGNILLGRTPETLTLTVTPDGLDFVAYPPDTQAARDAVAEIEAKMIRGCSFQFSVAPGGSDWDTDPETGGEIRTVKRIAKLYDVGPVTFPAYTQTNTDVAKRDYESARAQTRDADAPAVAEPEPTPATDPTALLSIYERRARIAALA